MRGWSQHIHTKGKIHSRGSYVHDLLKYDREAINVLTRQVGESFYRGDLLSGLESRIDEHKFLHLRIDLASTVYGV